MRLTKYIYKLFSSGFPLLSHNLLDMNQKMIHNILESNIDPNIKKKIIYNILDLTLICDHTASHFLSIYQDFIHHIM